MGFFPVFEVDGDENEKEYEKVHEEYKNLVSSLPCQSVSFNFQLIILIINSFSHLLDFQVDFMLGSYMEDIGISPEQFEAACGVASKKIKSQFHHALFEQVEKKKK